MAHTFQLSEMHISAGLVSKLKQKIAVGLFSENCTKPKSRKTDFICSISQKLPKYCQFFNFKYNIFLCCSCIKFVPKLFFS